MSIELLVWEPCGTESLAMVFFLISMNICDMLLIVHGSPCEEILLEVWNEVLPSQPSQYTERSDINPAWLLVLSSIVKFPEMKYSVSEKWTHLTVFSSCTVRVDMYETKDFECHVSFIIIIIIIIITIQ